MRRHRRCSHASAHLALATPHLPGLATPCRPKTVDPGPLSACRICKTLLLTQLNLFPLNLRKITFKNQNVNYPSNESDVLLGGPALLLVSRQVTGEHGGGQCLCGSWHPLPPLTTHEADYNVTVTAQMHSGQPGGCRHPPGPALGAGAPAAASPGQGRVGTQPHHSRMLEGRGSARM